MSLSHPDDWKTILSVLALVLSVLSFFFTRRSWLQSNRPIVSAVVETHGGGNELIAYNLVLSNTGNRPATNVRIRVKEIDIDACISEWVKNHKIKNATYSDVMRCFSNDGEVPLLLNGKSMINSFGYTRGDQQTFWRYGANLPVVVEYSDLDGRNYQSKQIIRIKDSDGFAGGVWQSSSN
ncbi:hypothetical protein BV921_15080 [Pectobacterium odoriferum]|uniref:hypothetical protein n=1 Tax=Pectobacterium odoriferum TaxID=78398 RepID=UPI000D4A2CB7|nr:hypothetical protein [Pectobacterium odoriferum]POE08553.1 hypothetical protein BV921_15080 [Pectobacterium odoriferum]